MTLALTLALALTLTLPCKAAELKHGNAVIGLLYGFSFVFDVTAACA